MTGHHGAGRPLRFGDGDGLQLWLEFRVVSVGPETITAVVRCQHSAVAQFGRVTVSKTVGCRFESCLPGPAICLTPIAVCGRQPGLCVTDAR